MCREWSVDLTVELSLRVVRSGYWRLESAESLSCVQCIVSCAIQSRNACLRIFYVLGFLGVCQSFLAFFRTRKSTSTIFLTGGRSKCMPSGAVHLIFDSCWQIGGLPDLAAGVSCHVPVMALDWISELSHATFLQVCFLILGLACSRLKSIFIHKAVLGFALLLPSGLLPNSPWRPDVRESNGRSCLTGTALKGAGCYG